ncbi:MAG: radical SAM protein, partial [Polyangiales bacterium]
VRAFERTGVTLTAAVDGELPPCVFDDPSAMKGVLRVGRALVERDRGRHRRIAQCEGCAAREVCPGPMAPIADEVAKVARTLTTADSLEGVVQLSRERTRMLQEYKSSFFLDSMSGVVERRIVRLVFHCNQACDFCFVSRELPAIEHEIIEREIRDAAAAGAVLDLSGGEPTLNARLPEYIRLARSLGVRELDLQTNAIKMSDPAYARELVDAGLNQAFVSLHGVSAAVSDRVTAAPGTFVKTVAGIKNLLSQGVSVCLNFVLCGYNVEDLAKFPDFVAEELGHPDKVVANFSFVAASTDNVPRDTKLIPRFRDVAWALEGAHAKAIERSLRWTGFDSKCGVPACYLPRALREEHFIHDLPPEELARAKGFTKSEACGECELDRRCYGIRSTYATMYGVDELRPIRNGEVQVYEPKRSRASEARVTDDAAFARLPVTWADEHPGGPDREIVQLHAGLRSVIKTERPDVTTAELSAATAIASGLVARVFADPRSSRAIAFVGRDQAAVDEAMDLEPRLITSFRERLPLVLRMGELLGYPACCVERFAKSPEQTDGALVSELAQQQRGPLPSELNWAAADIRLFSHFPCSPTCQRTADLGKKTLDAVAKDRPDYAVALLRALRSVAVLAPDGQYALLEGARADGDEAWAYDRVLSHRNLGVNDHMLTRTSFRTFYLETVAHLEKGNRLIRSGRALRVERDGAPVSDLRFADRPPWLLDFTQTRPVRRLPLIEGRLL